MIPHVHEFSSVQAQFRVHFCESVSLLKIFSIVKLIFIFVVEIFEGCFERKR